MRAKAKSELGFHLSARIFIEPACRYSILISDTVKVGQEKAVCLTEGTKATDEVMFFFQVCLFKLSFRISFSSNIILRMMPIRNPKESPILLPKASRNLPPPKRWRHQTGKWLDPRSCARKLDSNSWKTIPRPRLLRESQHTKKSYMLSASRMALIDLRTTRVEMVERNVRRGSGSRATRAKLGCRRKWTLYE